MPRLRNWNSLCHACCILAISGCRAVLLKNAARNSPCCAATWAVWGRLNPSMSAQSPMAYTSSAPLMRRNGSSMSRPLATSGCASAPSGCCRMRSSSLLVNVTGPTPAAHTHSPYGTTVPSESVMLVADTSCTRHPVRTLIPCLPKLRMANCWRVSSKVGRSTSPDWKSMIWASWATREKWRFRSFSRKSNISAANSTPVGPPPTMTMVASLFRSCSDVLG
mmetsp:Transcript_25787/g.44421  ORF Transcript_25787/g.44421 Transcript_25787/m.44421 type:complete len:221 (+) Transcript_25787:1449-2111(+)